MHENITLMCEVCKNRNYRTAKRTSQTTKIEIKKFCKFCRQHTSHKELKK